jgi:anaphase-promoting complex subunit 3
VKDLDRYSTALWHLKKNVELAHLSHELMELDRNQPEIWCIAGNNYSLQREHESAMKCFERAIMLNPDYAYAYNLLGHEYQTNEAFDKAQKCFRTAIRLDSRMYNAWYVGKQYMC